MNADAKKLIELDPWLAPYENQLWDRIAHTNWMRSQFESLGGLGGLVSHGHRFFGFNADGRDVVYREWAPNATWASLIGDFNGWDRGANPMQRDENGIWEVRLPMDALPHGSLVKVHLATGSGDSFDRVPAYITRAIQQPETGQYVGQIWRPAEEFSWQQSSPGVGSLRIYEAHVGMAQEHGGVGTYDEFRLNTLPRIAALGYNTVQLMAIQEHPYYGSFGYHVSSFYAPSSRFGTPDELKALVDAAHGMGLLVIMDLVHSHSVKNIGEGLNQFDGSDFQYFHAGGRGEHPAWDSKLFDYSKFEVQRFLLSNVRYWLEEFRFDGFRFDGVTSMLYHSHGLGHAFGNYDDYFGGDFDKDAAGYLALANEVAHMANPRALTIAEDVSGLPGLARPVDEGGIGFDYRLSMGVPDLWIKTLKEQQDEHWNLAHLYSALSDRRPGENQVGYCESHDQAIVGDKTIAFWLMDASMYSGMSVFAQDLVIDRGIALHKLIRLITFSLAGGGYLNFMGNEFGHPEWIDFPREGNNFSGHYARRQWSLVDAEHLRYGGLARFDQAMQRLDADYGILGDDLVQQLAVHEDTRQLIFRRGPLVFAFNFHATESFTDLRIPVPDATDYQLVLDSDAAEYGGHGRIESGCRYSWLAEPMYGCEQSTTVYLPSRSAIVLAPINNANSRDLL